jgi:uncharacterized protein (TIRG00374 family)
MKSQEEVLASREEMLEQREGGADTFALPTDEQEFPLFTRRRVLQTVLIVVVLVIGIYFLLPKLVGLGDALGKLDDASPVWIVIALGFNIAAFATYIALFRSVVGGEVLPLRWSEAYQINIAGLAATRLFAAGGAGGIALTYWALRKAGMEKREAARRMVAFLVLQYAFYPIALIAFGVLLRTGVLHGKSSLSLTIVPAVIAGAGLLIGLLVTLIPHDLERRIAQFARGHRKAYLAQRLARGPAELAEGVRIAFRLFTKPSRGGLAVLGAAGFWASNVGILWASFHAFGVQVPLGVVVQGFFIGMAANLFPFAPAGVGAVDAGMIGAFLLFGLPDASVFPAVLTYRLIAFWLPIPPGIVAFFQLRGTIQRWQRQGLPIRRMAADADPRQYFRK